MIRWKIFQLLIKVISKIIFLIHDVHRNNHFNSDKMYHSIASYETLNELQKNNLIKYKLIYKRLDPKNNCLENKRKYIAIVKKILN